MPFFLEVGREVRGGGGGRGTSGRDGMVNWGGGSR